MTNYYTFEESENILNCIDRSIKKAREIEMKKYPFAVVISPKNTSNLRLNCLTYLPKDGFKSIPIIKHPNVKEKEIKLAYSEIELIEIIKKFNYHI